MHRDDIDRLLGFTERIAVATERIAGAIEVDPETVRAQVDAELDRIQNAISNESLERERVLNAGLELLRELYRLRPEDYGDMPDWMKKDPAPSLSR